jgi:hypothetical protein
MTDYTEFPLGRYETVPEVGWPEKSFEVALCPRCRRPGRVKRLAHGAIYWHRVGHEEYSRVGEHFCVVTTLGADSNGACGKG